MIYRDLLQRLPQKPPMVMVDTIEDNGNVGMVISTNNVFCRNGIFQEAGILEHK